MIVLSINREFFQRVHDAPQAFVHTFDHGGHDGIVLCASRILLLLEVRAVVFLALIRRVHGVLPEVEVERFVLRIA